MIWEEEKTMREILFRGKRMDNGEWGEGFLARTTLGSTIIVNEVEEYSCGCCIGIGSANFEVDPSTVGQYTGLKDKHGNRIFEGDILHISRIADGLGGYYNPPLDYHVNVVVKWDLCAWMWETLCDDKRYISFPDAWCHYECEVIGNIHDNPELLKGGEG